MISSFQIKFEQKHILQYSDFVKQSLLDAGFLINEDKSSFNPVRILEWLGITWDSSSFALSIPDRRINDILPSLEHILSTKNV
jgi:hypothetical protein